MDDRNDRRELPSFVPAPVTLAGATVILEPLALSHARDLFQAAKEPTIWSFTTQNGFADFPSLENWIRHADKAMRLGTDVVFSIMLRETGRAVGSTRYMDIRREHRGLEIGWTWLAPEVQRTRVNTEAKYLLLQHAFETLGAYRVQFKTDARNVRSQRAIERIGGVKEGVLRRHTSIWNGFVRDTVYYSILDNEWPAVKERLEELLA